MADKTASEWTPERLEIHEYEAGRISGKPLVMLRDEENLESIECVRRPTARRIVAAWNACKGIETETLEVAENLIVGGIREAEARADSAEAMLRECEEYFDQRADAEYFPDSPSPHPNEEMKLLTEIRAFLDKTGERGLAGAPQ